MIMKNQPKQDDDWPVDLPPRSIDWDMVKHWLGIAVGWLFAFAVIGGLVWYFVREHSAAVRQKHADEMRQQQTASNIAALVAKYNTVTN